MILSFFLLAAFAAAVVGTVAGFGSATVLTPVAVFFMDIKTAIAVVAIYHLAVTASRVKLFWRHVDWRLFRLFGLSSLFLNVGGVLLASYVEVRWIQGALGLFLVSYASLSLIGKSPRLSARPGAAIIGGMFMGFVAGLIGTAGAIRAAFLSSFSLKKENYLATSAMIAVFVDAVRAPLYVAQGRISREMIWPLVALVIVAYAGTLIGKKVVEKVNPLWFKRGLLAFIGLVGLRFIGGVF